jgi:hypothetical protein
LMWSCARATSSSSLSPRMTCPHSQLMTRAIAPPSIG